MSYQYIELEQTPPIAKIWLNTPQNFNALSVPNLTEVYHALDECEKNPAIRVIILAARGKLFSSGGNVKEFMAAIKSQKAPQKIEEITEILHPCALKIMQMGKPVIGRIQGGAYGAGLNLVLSCDLVYAEENAVLDEAFANVGLSIDGSGSYTIPRMIGMKRAKELFWLGKITAKIAEKWGLINRALPANELDQYIETIALKLAELPPLNIINTKKLMNITFRNTIEQQLNEESKIQIKVAASDDFAEGVTAFFEKRKPRFKGK
ncbi:MAG: enoyl-CoA hydratase/isomerase family protein [Candidatus Helarchaeota archaeon]